MMNQLERSAAVVAAAVLHSDTEQRRLLQSIVEVARAIFAAGASSIFLLDNSGRLVFEAVAGAGEESLVGTEMPADRGIAGWVLTSGETMVVDDLAADTHFAPELAESTGYVPRTMLAAPLLCEGEPIGVIEVLDRTANLRRHLDDLDLLSLFAGQAAIAIDVLQRGRRAHQVVAGASHYRGLVDVVTALEQSGGRTRDAGHRLLSALSDLLAREW